MKMNVLLKEQQTKGWKKIAPPFTSLPAKFKTRFRAPDPLFCSLLNQKFCRRTGYKKQIKLNTALSSGWTKSISLNLYEVQLLPSVPRWNFILHRAMKHSPTPWCASLSCRRLSLQTSLGLVWAGITSNKGPTALTLMGKFRSVQWTISWHVINEIKLCLQVCFIRVHCLGCHLRRGRNNDWRMENLFLKPDKRVTQENENFKRWNYHFYRRRRDDDDEIVRPRLRINVHLISGLPPGGRHDYL